MVFKIYHCSWSSNNGKVLFYCSKMVSSWTRRWTSKFKKKILYVYLFILYRSNEHYQLLVKWKNKNFHMFYQRKHIIVYLMVIYGFRSFLVHHQIDLLVFNDVLVVLCYFLYRCYWILCIMIYQMMLNQQIKHK